MLERAFEPLNAASQELTIVEQALLVFVTEGVLLPRPPRLAQGHVFQDEHHVLASSLQAQLFLVDSCDVGLLLAGLFGVIGLC